MSISIKRVYDPPSPDDGRRVLVDRLWPRGLTKEAAAVDVWLKEIAPSTELRKWYHAGNEWEEFRRRYLQELDANRAALEQLRVQYTGKKSELSGLMAGMKQLKGPERAEAGKALNLREFAGRRRGPGIRRAASRT